MVSIVIPACNEIYLQKTIDNILERAESDIEIIAYLDAYWPQPAIHDHPKVVLIHDSQRRGMRHGINAAVSIARGEFIMKTDAHCSFAKGFDVALSENCEDNWLVVPRRYNLRKDNWGRGSKITDHMFIGPPKRQPPHLPKHWEHGFHGERWVEYCKRPEAQGDLCDLMSFQGSCFFMPKKLYEAIGGEEVDKFGRFAYEAQELGNKVWLSGGRVVRNKKTWYAHLHKGKEMGRGYSLSRTEITRTADNTVRTWMNNEWPKQIRPLEWLINHFAPVPGWDGWDWSEKW